MSPIRSPSTLLLLTGANHLRYYRVCALVSLVLPNLLIFSVIPRLGSGFTGVWFTLSPVFTLLLSAVWRSRPYPRPFQGSVAASRLNQQVSYNRRLT